MTRCRRGTADVSQLRRHSVCTRVYGVFSFFWARDSSITGLKALFCRPKRIPVGSKNPGHLFLIGTCDVAVIVQYSKRVGCNVLLLQVLYPDQFRYVSQNIVRERGAEPLFIQMRAAHSKRYYSTTLLRPL